MYTMHMKELFLAAILLGSIFVLPPWLTFGMVLVYTLCHPSLVLVTLVTGIILDTLYQIHLFDNIPLYSLLGIVFVLIIPRINRVLAW